ncbi:hypothetical protein GGS24DRAFT_498457 [Hypoxylon argillaceum]|nr:hypothetical protein GGS24DRAFT_498457 [Hypoxylon argillaceum]
MTSCTKSRFRYVALATNAGRCATVAFGAGFTFQPCTLLLIAYFRNSFTHGSSLSPLKPWLATVVFCSSLSSEYVYDTNYTPTPRLLGELRLKGLKRLEGSSKGT